MKKFLHAKIHRALVTQLDPEYEGSITICSKLLRYSGIKPYENVLVADINTGVRFETYVIKGEDGIIGINGAAANMDINLGDRVIIMAFDYSERLPDRPKIVIVDDSNDFDEYR